MSADLFWHCVSSHELQIATQNFGLASLASHTACNVLCDHLRTVKLQQKKLESSFLCALCHSQTSISYSWEVAQLGMGNVPVQRQLQSLPQATAGQLKLS